MDVIPTWIKPNQHVQHAQRRSVSHSQFKHFSTFYTMCRHEHRNGLHTAHTFLLKRVVSYVLMNIVITILNVKDATCHIHTHSPIRGMFNRELRFLVIHFLTLRSSVIIINQRFLALLTGLGHTCTVHTFSDRVCQMLSWLPKISLHSINI